MDANIAAVLLSCLLYSLYVLLPMIPAVVIYRLFPETKVALSGLLAILSLKSTGAFAAYVVTVILGFFLVKDTHAIIAGMVQPMWTIKATLELQDADGKRLDDQSALKYLEVFLTPDVRVKEGKFIKLRVPSTGVSKPEYVIKFTIPQFGEQTIDTSQLKTAEIDVNTFDKVLSIENPISIKHAPISTRPYTKNEYQTPSN